eukprot:c38024_g1_i1 orf=39-302(+)
MSSKNSESALETKLVSMINLNKKNSDNAINTIQRDLLTKMIKMEEEWQSKMRQMEEEWNKDREKWKTEKKEWKKEREDMHDKINLLM